MAAKPQLLLVEDDRALADLVRFHFEAQGYRVLSTPDGDEGLLLAREYLPDVVILDWMVEGTSGLEICRQLRSLGPLSHVPIVMLTARGTEDDKVRGLQTGADDYLTKPFSPRELMARVAAILRRVRPALGREELTAADIILDTGRHLASRDGKPLKLGPTEFRLLSHLMEHPGQVFSRGQLLDAVWGQDRDIEMRTVDVHIRRLRKSLAMYGGSDPIRTVRSAGYAFDAAG
ncbi:phosphate regulon transcriptional regulator PhoB [Croceicoccus sp. F390]|uniref:Phosphate regulon transcriptional regulatory protein PhoB n=1 Tax=Croceicoccus esteveae TaxID=3075597 RepID=A0ABU2ZF01_9SPHN|nr:phosphate regulon transcriptional regulator PhoB [Croceicoccus sp. F390]MDT0575169.1 phosphate regulon transcriptional regulator PhoB [Croceicoccus sp. F390]